MRLPNTIRDILSALKREDSPRWEFGYRARRQFVVLLVVVLVLRPSNRIEKFVTVLLLVIEDLRAQ